MNSDDIGKLVLRLTLGVLILFHGVHKLLTGIDPIRNMIVAHHLPDFLAYGVYVGEVFAPLLVIFGIFSRIGGLLIAVNLVVAILLVHMGTLFGINEAGGYGLELQAFYLFSAIAVSLTGAGRISLGGADGRFN
jgi:putative oxidoreductase